jgi:hypothetical protein
MARGAARFAASSSLNRGEIVTQEHWRSNGFANTDLDLQLKKHGIHKLVIMGLIAHTCVEATVRYTAELGYEVTVVKDATASYSDEEMHAALDVNIPNYAGAVLSTNEVVEALSFHVSADTERFEGVTMGGEGGAQEFGRRYHETNRFLAGVAVAAMAGVVASTAPASGRADEEVARSSE